MTQAQLNGLLSAVRTVLLLFGAFLAQNGYGHSDIYHQIEMVSSAILIIGPGVWGVLAAVSGLFKAHAVGVQAGINMTVQGKALAADGVTPVHANDGTTPPLAVTLATAAEIVKDFAPPPNTIAAK